MAKKRAAVIGFGGMGRWHATSFTGGYYWNSDIKASDVVELAGVYDIDPEKCRLAESLGIKAFPSIEALLADETIEIVTIATPNDVHEELAIKALNAGKNVICEKPVTISLESLDRMIDCANKNGKLLTVHQNRRWDIYFLEMKQIKDQGDIGDILSLESRVQGSNGVPDDWRKVKEKGGGMLYDWGVHMIDQALNMLGYDVEKVYCVFEHLTTQEVDDGFYLDIHLKDNTRIRVEVNTYNFIPLPIMYMRGTAGSAIVRDWSNRCQVVRCKDFCNTDVVPVKLGSGLSKTMAPRSDETIDSYQLAHPHVDVHDFYRNFCAAIDGKEKQLVTHEQMRSVMKVIMAAFESAETGKVVKL